MTDPVNPLWSLQAAVYAVLASALAPTPVYDDPPPSAPYPHVEIGEVSGVDAGAASFDLDDVTLTMHVWSRYAGSKEARGLLATIRASLHDKSLPLSGGHQCLRLRAAFETVFIDADGRTRHGVIRFAALIERAE